MFRLSGNIYDLLNGFYESRVYNILPAYCTGLDGHYTLIFTKEAEEIHAYKHGDYAGFTTIKEVEFEGFMELTTEQTEFFREIIIRCMQGKLPYEHPDRKYASEAIFDYSFDIFGQPIYLEQLNNLK